MATLQKLPGAAKSLHEHIGNLSKDPKFKNRGNLSPEQEQQRKAARKHALDSIDGTINMINASLQKQKAQKAAHEASRALRPKRTPLVTPTDPNLQAVQVMIGESDQLNGWGADLDTAGLVLGAYNNILNVPNLSTWSGTLEAVPLVGITPGVNGGPSQVNYMSKQLQSDGSGGSTVVDVWQKLDNMPAEPSGNDTRCLFSYKGYLCTAVGSTIYQKIPKPTTDPTIVQAATDNWAKMWQDGWSLTTANALSVSDARALIAWNALTGSSVTTSLVLLGSDSSLSYYTGNIAANMSFTAMTYQPSQTYPTAPPLQKIASWANYVWGYAATTGTPTIYKLQISTGANTWSVVDTLTMTGNQNTIVDMAAVDTGLVVALSDGKLYNWTLAPSGSGDGTISTSWQIWEATGGNTVLGEASPGEILDLKTLMTYAKSTYIAVQSDLYDPITVMQTYVGARKQLLLHLQSDQTKYNNTTDPTEKQSIADDAANNTLPQLKYYGKYFSSQLTAIDTTVVEMGAQLSNATDYTTSLLQSTQDTLAGLRSTLGQEQGELKTLEAEFWAAVGVSVAGFGLFLLGVITIEFGYGALLMAAGGLMAVASGIVAFSLGQQITDLTTKISGTQQQITNYTTTSDNLTTVNQSMTAVVAGYKGLDGFWGDLANLSSQISNSTDFGTDLMSIDPGSLANAINLCGDLTTSLENYVNFLTTNGFVPQDGDDSPKAGLSRKDLVLAAVSPEVNLADLSSRVEKAQPDRVKARNKKMRLVNTIFQAATERFAAKDFKTYQSLLKRAFDFSQMAGAKKIAVAA